MKLTICGLIGAALFSTSAIAEENPCAPREIVVQTLLEEFSETPRYAGLNGDNSIVEMFASDDTGTWTLLVSMANGISCLVASGFNFTEMDAAPSPTGLPL